MHYDHSYPPDDWTVDGLSEALTEYDDSLPTYDDAEAWTAVREDDLTAPIARWLLETAADARERPTPRTTASDYLDYVRTGNRRRYEARVFRRRRWLSTFTLAECLEREGRYLDAALDAAWAICEQTTWLLPAHLRDGQNHDGLPRPVPPEERRVALFSARAAHLLAEVDYVLGERLHPALRERIRREVDERVLTPYEARDDFSWMQPPYNNWNAVCNASVALAALHLEGDGERTARILRKAVASLGDYLGSFDPDGCTAEGVGYWNFGVGHYVRLAVALEERTDGAFSLFDPPVVEKLASYPAKVGLSPGRTLPFSDAKEDVGVSPYTACRLGDRFDLPDVAWLGRHTLAERGTAYPVLASPNLTEALRNLHWCRDVAVEPPKPEPREFLAGSDWWLARATPSDPDGLVVAAKGGHNGESHNHNDCGSFVVHVRGESLLTDLGRPGYDRDYFGEGRYEFLAARSLGHSVPRVNGHEQATGADYAAEVVDRIETPDRDALELELGGCYPEGAGVESLERTLALDREAGTVTLTDRVAFARNAPAREVESVLVSYHPIDAREGTLRVRGDRGRLRIDPADEPRIRVERLEDAVDATDHEDEEERHRDVWRARLRPRGDGRRQRVSLTVRPV